jgi:ectoine hydroxylase
MKLTTDQRAQFDRDGYLFFPGHFSADARPPTLTRCGARAVQPARGLQRARERQSDAVRTNFAAHLVSEPFARLARHPRMVGPVTDLFDEEVYMHQFKINGKMAFEGDVWQWHQDYGTWLNDDLMPTERAMNVAIFLDDVSEHNGPLMFIPGSHTQGRGRGQARPHHHQLPAVDGRQRPDRAAGGPRRRQGRRHRLAPRARPAR